MSTVKPLISLCLTVSFSVRIPNKKIKNLLLIHNKRNFWTWFVACWLNCDTEIPCISPSSTIIYPFHEQQQKPQRSTTYVVFIYFLFFVYFVAFPAASTTTTTTKVSVDEFAAFASRLINCISQFEGTHTHNHTDTIATQT